jgi:hypothetical protein
VGYAVYLHLYINVRDCARYASQLIAFAMRSTMVVRTGMPKCLDHLQESRLHTGESCGG